MKFITSYDTEKGIAIIEKINGKRICTYLDNIIWYFYLLSKDVSTNKELIEKYIHLGLITKVERLKDNPEYAKVYARKERGDCNINDFKEEAHMRSIPLFEFDLSKSKRYLIDNNIEMETNLRVLYYDIETSDEIGNIEIGRDEILSWAACDQEGKTWKKAGNEEKILRSFTKLIEKYDIIASWNGDEFDLPYLQMRCLKYGIVYYWQTIIHIDLLQRVFKLYAYDATHIGLENFKLNTVGKFFLGKEKIELQGKKIHELYKENLDLLLEYNLNDTLILKELDEKLQIIPLMIAECSLTYSSLNKFYVGELIDNYILRKAKSKGVILESKASKFKMEDLRTTFISGGYVKEPLKGYYDNVHVCDFKSLYPSIIIGWNIGIDVLDKNLSEQGEVAYLKFLNGKKIEEKKYKEWIEFLKLEKLRLDPENKYFQAANNSFFKKEESLIPNIVQEFLDLRKVYRDKLKNLEVGTSEYNLTFANSMIYKELANSMFGITCQASSRYFNKYTSQGITVTGQFLNKMSAWIAEQQGLKVIYGDTDSIFCTGPIVINSLNSVMNNMINEDFGLVKNIVTLEYEKMYSKFLLLEKKKYSGLLGMKDGKQVNKLFSRGTTDVQKSNTKYGIEMYMEVINLIFSGVSFEKMIEFIKKKQKELYNGKVDVKQLVKTIKVTKNPEDYAVNSVNSRLVERLLNEKKILPINPSKKKMGTRLSYVITNINGRNEAMLIDELKTTPDYTYYWEKEIFAPIKRVCQVVWPKIDWEIYNLEKQQATLF